jgi:hypothetical protein
MSDLLGTKHIGPDWANIFHLNESLDTVRV